MVCWETVKVLETDTKDIKNTIREHQTHATNRKRKKKKKLKETVEVLSCDQTISVFLGTSPPPEAIFHAHPWLGYTCSE